MSLFNTPTTLNNIIGMFTQIAAEHKMINSFGYGPVGDINIDSPVMPHMFVVPIDSTVRDHTIDLTYDIHVFDLVKKGDLNRNEVHSDTFQTLLDIKAFINKNLLWDTVNSYDSDIEPLWEFADDESTGHKMTLRMQLDWDANVCNIPGMFPSGVTFTNGCNGFINTGCDRVDVYVTSGTYNSSTGEAIFTNNTGGTFTVTGFTSGSTGNDQYWVSGSTGDFSVKTINDSSVDATGDYALAEGQDNKAIGNNSHAEGQGSTASGLVSHSEGVSSIASNTGSHAEGYGTTSSGIGSHSEGSSTRATGDSSHAEGTATLASNTNSHSEGALSTASGLNSHSEGQGTKALGQASHAEGFSTTASGNTSHTEGASTKANGVNSHAEGDTTTASGTTSHAEGLNTLAGDYSHAEGLGTTAADSSHSEGSGTLASGQASHAEGDSTIASGQGSHAEGTGSEARGNASHAEGGSTTAIGAGSHSEGTNTTAISDSSHASGDNSIASGDKSFIHSYNSIVSGDRSVLLGGQNLTGTTNDTVYVPYFNIHNLASGSSVNLLGIDATGFVVSAATPTFNDTYVTGFTFNAGNYDLTIKQNQGQADKTVNLGILAGDIYVTGGTYNSSTGTATFSNNSGGSFNVTGFITGFTDIYTTGFTYSNNVFTLRRNDNTNISVVANVMSGLTINGTLLVNTISATTYQNLPIDPDTYVTGGTANNSSKTYTFTNNTGGTFTVIGLTDIVVTGGTYSNGTAVFTNNTGGTFNVSGFFTGATDIHTTGFSYNNNTFTISDNVGSAYTATINTMTGLTVNGTLSATTISANTFGYIDGNQFAKEVLTSDSNGLASWHMPYLVGDLTYFFSNSIAITGGTNYYNAFTTLQTSAQQTIISTSVADATLIAVFISPSGGTGYNFFPAGMSNIYLNMSATTSGAKTTQFYYELYKRTSGGTETLLGTSNYSDTVTTANTIHTSGLYMDSIITNVSDRIVAKVYAHITGAGSAPNITIFCASTNHSRVQMPVVATDSTNFVPYTGAIQSVNLGPYSLTATTYYGDGSNLTGISGDTSNFVTGGTFNYNTKILTLNKQGSSVAVTGFNDIFVTGGTYNNPTGTVTFKNNTGGTFTVTGFLTGSTDTTVTGGTYDKSSGIETFTNNTGGTFTVTGITDVYATGMTFTSSVLTLNQNNGGPTLTAVINGSSITGATDTFVTGATYSTGGTLSILQNQSQSPVTVNIQNTGAIINTINGNGGTISTGQKGGFITIPYTGYITGWDIYSTDGLTGGTLSGNIIVDVWKDTYANFPPTSGDTIFSTGKPTLTAQSKNTASGLAIAVTQGDVLGFNVTSATTVTLVNVVIKTSKS